MKKGQTIYYVEWGRGYGYYSKGIKETTITKVGMLYFSVEGGGKEARIKTMRDGNESDNHRQYFLSIREHDLFFEKIRLESIFRKFVVSSSYTEIPIDKLRAIVKIIEQ